MTPADIVAALRASSGFAHKRDIADVVAGLSAALPVPATVATSVPIGDDCAAIMEPDGSHLLFAIEGLVEEFVERMPWFAGYCSVMVNVSDIHAMGGRPLAVVDAVWSRGGPQGEDILSGMAAAARRYGVPIVGGHSNSRSSRPQVAVAILGRAQRLLTSFDARPGDRLMMAVDLRGQWRDPYPYWDASTQAPAERLRQDLSLLPSLAQDGLCRAAKDISMAGTPGTALMLLECSQVGARIDLDALPRPACLSDAQPASWLRWLGAFPSFGFLLSVAPDHVDEVRRRFIERDLACAVVGEVTEQRQVQLLAGGQRAVLWDFELEPFMTGCVAAPAQACDA